MDFLTLTVLHTLNDKKYISLSFKKGVYHAKSIPGVVAITNP
jgi:hypothetical protein